jgi:hypothetical protein
VPTPYPQDHFSFATFGQTYRQRYFFCPHFWQEQKQRRDKVGLY